MQANFVSNLQNLNNANGLAALIPQNIRGFLSPLAASLAGTVNSTIDKLQAVANKDITNLVDGPAQPAVQPAPAPQSLAELADAEEVFQVKQRATIKGKMMRQRVPE